MTAPPAQRNTSSIPHDAQIYTVSRLNRDARSVLERNFDQVWITGEISNLARPGSGHLYFSLKDEDSQVRCAMFRGANRTLSFVPQDGLQVIVRARVTIYEPRGTYQLIAEYMEPAGEGLLRRRFEELKAKLAGEGLFDPARKTALPRLPGRIGLVTSPTGAAVRDMLHILARRFPSVPVVIYPVQVQGEQAVPDIVRALETAAARAECDVLIVGRGGGSLEDLWAFNEERVARAVFACPIPVVSAVGHEIDYTICDLVADLRAPTPSAAAELVVPDRAEWLGKVRALNARAASAIRQVAGRQRERMTRLDGRLQRRNPVLLLEQYAQRLDDLGARAGRALRQRVRLERLGLSHTLTRLRANTPLPALRERSRVLAQCNLRLVNSMRASIDTESGRLAVLAAQLSSVSPLDTLKRGYAIVETADGVLVRSTKDIKERDEITGRLADGRFTAIVGKLLPN